ncbi:MAG: transglutaminase-like domain-containing protein, partial [Planctomycetota bacterium]
KIKIRPTFQGRFRKRVDYKIIKERKFNNRFIYILLPKSIAKHIKHLEIEAKYKILRREFQRKYVEGVNNFLTKIDKKKFRKYLTGEKYIPINKYYIELSNKITAGHSFDYEKLYSLYKYVANHGKYYKLDITKLKPSGLGYSKYCDEFGTGNCTDYHAYFMSLARPAGFPVRFVMGSYLNPKNDGKNVDAGYHCWVETYIPPYGWIPLDPSWGNYFSNKKEYYFLNLEEERVVFTYGRNFFLPGVSYRVNYFAFATILISKNSEKYSEFKNYTRKLRFRKSKYSK